VADREDAAVQAVEPAAPDAVIDRVVPKPGRHELRAGHDPVLMCRNLRDRGIDGSRGTESATYAGKRLLDCHSPMVARLA
jgi:hypothetical protein